MLSRNQSTATSKKPFTYQLRAQQQKEKTEKTKVFFRQGKERKTSDIFGFENKDTGWGGGGWDGILISSPTIVP